jgi:peptide/nickel transport system substrate-binding protein
MNGDGHEVWTGVPAPCGHRNPPGSRFCDVCGSRLSAPCPGCHAINRSEANFCSRCGTDLRALPSRVAVQGGAAEEPDSTRALLDHIGRFLERQRRARRRSKWLAAACAVMGVGLLGAVLSFGRSPWPARVGADRTTAAIIGVPVRGELGDSLRHSVAMSSRGDQRPSSAPPLAGPRSPDDRPGWSVLSPDSRPPVGETAPSATLRPMASLAGAVEPSPIASTGLPTRPDPPDPRPAAPQSSPAASPVHPRAGGELTFVVPAEPPSYDAHREETFALMHPAAPHYNTLLRIDPFDRTGSRVVGDLAESWAVSPDKRTYVLKLRRGVKFHDGSELTSRDVMATYQKIINPPAGLTSVRKGEYLAVELVMAPEPYVVAFKLKWPSPSFIHSLASPWNWIYKADILERDFHWYETHVMGTGPFVFVEHVKGSHWVGRRNPDYWDAGKPYLDGYRALFVRDEAAQAFAIRAERADIQFRGFSPAQRDDLVRTLGDKVTVQESPWNCGLVVALNHDQKPFDDRRVRRALSLALDRYQAAGALSKIAIVRDVAGLQVPHSLFATSPAELVKLAGYGRDIRTSRAEARRLLADAGLGNGFSFTLKNRSVPMPYEYIGTWLVDQWRQIGVNVRQDSQDSGLYFRDLRAGNFEVSTDFQCGYVVDPDLDLYKFQSRHLSDANYGRYTDPVLDDLYLVQSRTVDPEQRRHYIRAFEKRLLDEEAHYISTLQWHRIVPHSSRVRGWTITPSHYLNNQLDTVWLAE